MFTLIWKFRNTEIDSEYYDNTPSGLEAALEHWKVLFADEAIEILSLEYYKS